MSKLTGPKIEPRTCRTVTDVFYYTTPTTGYFCLARLELLNFTVADAVDALLEEADQNDDGLISWREYLTKVRSFVGEPTE